ncbi:protein FAM98B isoform X1 [Phyllopteryx taeniolatus]|uniref:protein FAM98B isoform X1 n=1 Tax=Phyllopteryx taeniolatus TaxID=161469 RepID=UPI002AD45B21|nr:protein FAM98B isoform X1 [Phyllopteryx taeniolatus]
MECDILDSLEQLGYEGPLTDEAALLQAAQGGLSSAEYVDLCRWLVSRLKPLCGLEESITTGPEDLLSLEVDLRGLLKELCCPYQVTAIQKGKPKDHLKFVLFLSSELQAAQIIIRRRGLVQGQNGSSVSRELREICQTLNVSPCKGQDAVEFLSLIQSKVVTLVEKCPDGTVGKPALKSALSSEQWEKLHSMNALMSSEYECRRRMLIKRLDVTIQSFGWSDRAKAKVDSMARAYQPKRHALRAEATVDAAALLASREDVCNVVKTSSGASRANTACAVNKIQMGRVPYRGGRPSEIEAPLPEMPPWQKRQDGGGNWGGRGQRGGGGWRGGGGGGWGGRGGGGGWGGGGDWHGGRHNHGGHGGKRGRYQY